MFGDGLPAQGKDPKKRGCFTQILCRACSKGNTSWGLQDVALTHKEPNAHGEDRAPFQSILILFSGSPLLAPHG